MTQGLKQAGFVVAAGIEIDALAVETYALNHGESQVLNADIRLVDPVEVLDAVGLNAGELDLLAGCPPCQSFSSLTTLNGNRNRLDPRAWLLEEFGRFADIMRPRAILMENVPGIARDGRFVRLLRDLEDLGYPAMCSWQIVDAADHGVPQRRRRLVLMTAMQRKIAFPEALAPRRTVRDAIGELPMAGESGDPLHDVPERRSERVRQLIRKIPLDGGGRFSLGAEDELNCHKGFSGFKDVYGRMAWDEPSPTITGGCHNPSKGRFLHPREQRAITLREAALLQSFPADYKFSLRRGKLAAASMIGNALPPLFVERHARAIATDLVRIGRSGAA